MDAASITLVFEFAWNAATALALSLENAAASTTPRPVTRGALLLALLLLGVAAARALAWYCRTKARLDAAVRNNPDEVLADRELRALRRALLMVDVKRHIPRLFRKIRHLRAYNKITAETRRESRAARPLHSSTPANMNGSPPGSPSSTGAGLGSNSSPHAASEAALEGFGLLRTSTAAKNASNLAQNIFENDIDDCERLLNAAGATAAAAETPPMSLDAGASSETLKHQQSECLQLLREHTLFKYVAPELLVKLARNAREKVLEEGTELFTIGNRVEFPSLYIVKSGEIETYVRIPGKSSDGRAVTNRSPGDVTSPTASGPTKRISRLGPGDTLSALLDLLATLCALPIVSHVTAVASAKATTVYKWDHSLLAQMAKEDPVSIGRLIRMIMVKLNRATFSTMYQYLGLTTELTNGVTAGKADEHLKDDARQFLFALENRANLVEKCQDIISGLFGVAKSSVPHISVPRKLSFSDRTDSAPASAEDTLGSDRAAVTGNQRARNQRYDDQKEKALSSVYEGSGRDFDPVLRAASTHTPIKTNQTIQPSSSSSSSSSSSTSVKNSAAAPNMFKSSMVRSLSTPNNLGTGECIAFSQRRPSISATDSHLNLESLGTTTPITTHAGLHSTFISAESLEIIRGRPGEVLASPGNSPCLFVVLAGRLDVMLPLPHNNTPAGMGVDARVQYKRDNRPGEDSRMRRLFQVTPGGLVGLLPLQTGEPWNMLVRCPLATCYSTTRTQVADAADAADAAAGAAALDGGVLVIRVRRSAYSALVQSHPRVVFRTAALLLGRLSPLLRLIDYGLQWRHMQPGDVLVRQGQPCDSLYVVLHGRLREMIGVEERGGGEGDQNDTQHEYVERRSSFSTEGYFMRDVRNVGSCAVAGGTSMIVDGRKDEMGKRKKDKAQQQGSYTANESVGRGRVRNNGTAGADLNNHNIDVEEYGRGSCLGESEILARAPHTATVCAIRESEIVEMPRDLFHLIVDLCPEVLQHVTKNISMRLVERMERTRNLGTRQKASVGAGGAVANISTIALLPITLHADAAYLARVLSRSLANNCKVVTVSSRRVSRDLGINVTESNVKSSPHDKFTLMSYLSQLEEMHSLVIYECDPCDQWPSNWTATCLRQADVVLLVANAFDPPDVTDFERWAVQHLSYAQNVLVLLHDMDLVERTREARRMARRRRWAKDHSVIFYNESSGSSAPSLSRGLVVPKDSWSNLGEEEDDEDEGIERHALWSGYRPRNTRNWFKERQKDANSAAGSAAPVYTMGIQHHMHIRIYKSDSASTAQQTNNSSSGSGSGSGSGSSSSSSNNNNNNRTSKSSSSHNDFDGSNPYSDCARLGRWLMGTQVGLTLGGGGARGLAHVGTYEALMAAGVPVDVVGGTSQGAFIGALIAMIHNPRDILGTRKELVRLSRKYAEEMSSNYAKIKDLTFPITAYFHGEVFNAGMMRHFGDIRIEDLWLDYFCISTDLTDSREVVHHSGMLWKYVRASMTLGPYLAPICEVEENDPEKVHYLADGGYVNNLPADEMRRTQAPLCVIAVDVSSYWNFGGVDYGDAVSGWRQLFASWKIFFCFRCFRCCRRPGRGKGSIPSMSDISSQLAYVSNARQLPDRLRNDISLYLKPGVAEFGTLEFGSFGAIRDIGFKHARRSLVAWKAFLEEEGDPMRERVFL